MHNQKSQKERQNSRSCTTSFKARREGSSKNRTPSKLNIDFAIEYVSRLLTDAHQNIPPYREADLSKDLKRLKKRAKNEGPAFFLQTMPVLIEGLFQILEGNTAIFPGFRVRNGYPVFLGRLFHIAHRQTRHHMYVTDALDALYTVSVSFKKLRGTYDKEKLAIQYSDFEKVDADLPALSLNDSVLWTARRYCAAFIEDIDVDGDNNCIPRPGPGATNRPLEKELRYGPHILFKTIDKVLPYDEWFYPHMWDVVEQSRNYLNLEKLSEPSSRFKFVPKTAGKARGICIEYNETQFLQQAVSRLLRTHINKKLGKNIALNDQTVNGDLAVSSSIDRWLSTIDMSDASDRISRHLVSFLFADNPRLREVLLALSTRLIEPPKEAGKTELLKARKFAPMGSALCFPVMSLVHYFLIKAIVLHTGRASSLQDSQHIYVYGDDILLPTEYTEEVYQKLPNYGMRLNTSKSFYNSNFRESCGKHAYYGRDVTPVYVKHTPFHKSLEALASCLAVERDLFEKRFYATARYLRTLLTQLHPNLSEVQEGTGLLGFLRKQPALAPIRYKVRWQARFHRYEVRATRLSKRRSSVPIDNASQALLRWYGTNNEWDTAEMWKPDSELCIRTGWVPAQDVFC